MTVARLPLQDGVNRAPGGVSYGTNMPPELMQNHPYGRLPYGQQAMNMYTQNQPLPPGEPLTPPHRCWSFVRLCHWFGLQQGPF